MKREKNTTESRVKTRKSSVSSSSSSSEDQSRINSKSPQRINSSGNQSNITVQFQNANMLTKYRNKNPHIKIENPRTTSNFLSDELSDDDEIWICEIPNAIDVTKLVGKSVKLGSKKTAIQTENGSIECASSKFDSSSDVYRNTLSVVFQNNESKLSVKNIKPVGRMTLYSKVDDTPDEIELSPPDRHPCTIFPLQLVVRHPLLGRKFEDKINISETIKKKLKEAPKAIESIQSIVHIKQEEDANQISLPTSTRKTKKRKAESSKEQATPVKVKKEVKSENGHDDDLVRIKQIFEKNN